VSGPKIGLQLRPAIDERPFLHVSEKHPPHDRMYAPEVVRNGRPYRVRESIEAALKDSAKAALPNQQAFRERRALIGRSKRPQQHFEQVTIRQHVRL
jgi:hypothetical protein